MTVQHSVRFTEHGFWVIHRRLRYGPFDYEWSSDLRGIEMTYRREKFGEYCSPEELFADMSTFQLPQTVVSVATIVMGAIVEGILAGVAEEGRQMLALKRLRELGFARFTGMTRGD